MSKVTNLRQFRKEKARREKRASGEENAVRFGRSKAQRTVEAFDAERAKATLDGAKRDNESVIDADGASEE
ncbi:DUF4169 family protein [Celeribacter sp.]|uniref:DUF4169 family protein n=1 Tax=Celeribacter sp. TaxID=1890673 RepID=UPI003A9247A9